MAVLARALAQECVYTLQEALSRQAQRHLVAKNQPILGSLQRLGSLPLEGHRLQPPFLGTSLQGRGLSAGHLVPELAPVHPHQASLAHSISTRYQGHLAAQVRAVRMADVSVAKSRLLCTWAM